MHSSKQAALATFCRGDKTHSERKQLKEESEFPLAEFRHWMSIMAGGPGGRNRKPRDHISTTYRKQREQTGSEVRL